MTLIFMQRGALTIIISNDWNYIDKSDPKQLARIIKYIELWLYAMLIQAAITLQHSALHMDDIHYKIEKMGKYKLGSKEQYGNSLIKI